MALDGIILSKIKDELNKNLPMRINKISEISKNEIVFNVHANKERRNLIMSFHPIYNHISLSNENYNSFIEPGNFVMVLRKHLNNGIIDKIEQIEYDRYLLLHIRNRDELYDEKEYLLSIELMGKYANLILINGKDNKIIDAFRKIPPYENNKRTILTGALFIAPESQNKKDPYNHEDININESLVLQLQGFSKVLDKEVHYRLNNNEDYKTIINEIKNSNELYITQNKDEYQYHVIPLTHLGTSWKRLPIMNALDEIFYERDEKERVKSVSDDLFKVVKRQIKHFENKIGKLNESLNSAYQLEDDKNKGDLLYTYSNIEQKGLDNVEIKDYEDNIISIKLDPKLSIKANANKYYQAYQKKRKGQIHIKEQLEIANNQLEYFLSVKEQLEIANYQDSITIKEELVNNGYLKEKNKSRKSKDKRHLYQIIVDDAIITFGKNNLQNDLLTWNYAHKNYMWFHAKDFHGSHVVVNQEEPNEKIIRICANIAAYYSQGRYSSSVPVEYTQVKNLKKVKGMPSGFVTLKTYKTIYIDPFDDKELSITII